MSEIGNHIAVHGAAAADVNESENYKNLFPLRSVHGLLSFFIFLL